MENESRGSPPGNSAGSPTPRWLWPLVLGGFGLIFWKFAPADGPQVPYSPWFLDQVARGNVRSVAIRGTELHGQLRAAIDVPHGHGSRTTMALRFVTHAPSAEAIESLMRSLHEREREPVAIELESADPSRLRWWMAVAILFLLGLSVSLVIRAIAAALGR